MEPREPADAERGRNVVIVGAGVAGTSVFVHVVRALGRCPGRPPRSVRLVDPRPVGWGLAFGDSDPLLLCNTAAEVNSLLADHPGDFTDYLREHGWTGRPEDCVPRARLAEYCEDRFTEARAEADRYGVAVRHIRDTVVSVTAGGGGRRTVRLGSGRQLTADAVVVCTGVHRPRVPDGFAGFTGHPRYLDSPYPADRISRRLRPRSRVLVLGTRQSAVDAAMLLGRDGHRTTMTSRSGTLPAVRWSLAAPERELPPLERIAGLDGADPLLAERLARCVVEGVRLLGGGPLRAQTSAAADPVRRLREETALVAAGACRWPGVVLPVMERGIELGARLGAPQRRELLDHFAPLLSRYLTAMTAVNARRLLGHFDSGLLRLAPAYPAAASFTDGEWRVTWPGQGGGRTERFDYVVNATGFRLPELYWNADGTALHLDRPPHGGSAALGRLEADLRVRRRPGAAAEDIWVAGVGTHVQIPFSNHLRNVVRQARDVAEQVVGKESG